MNELDPYNRLWVGRYCGLKAWGCQYETRSRVLDCWAGYQGMRAGRGLSVVLVGVKTCILLSLGEVERFLRVGNRENQWWIGSFRSDELGELISAFTCQNNLWHACWDGLRTGLGQCHLCVSKSPLPHCGHYYYCYHLWSYLFKPNDVSNRALCLG